MKKITANRKHITAFIRSAKLIYKADRKNAFLLLLLAPLQGLAPIFCAFFVSRIVNMLSQLPHTIGGIVPLLIGWGTCTLLNYILSPISIFVQGELTDNLSNSIHCSVFDKTAQIEDMKTAESAAFQDEIQVLQGEVSYRPVNLVIFSVNTVSACITVLGLLGGLIGYNPVIAMLLILGLIPQSIVLYRLQGEAFDNLVQRSPLSRQLNNYSDILLERDYAKELRLFHYDKYIRKLYSKTFGEIYKSNCHMRRRKLAASIAFFLLGALFCTLAFGYAVHGAFTGKLNIGDVSLFASYIVLANATLIGMADDFAMLYDTIMFMEKFFSFIDRPPEMLCGDKKISEEGITSIEFKDVSFTYPDSNEKALDHITFAVHKGESIGLVGLNGSGKSTIFKLLCRLYDVDEGEIVINGYSITEYDIQSLRQQFRIAFQDFSKYQLSVEENVFLSDVDRQQRNMLIDKVLKRVKAEEFVRRLPEGKNQYVGKRMKGSVDLSGGEWQKLALARALYKRGSVLLFDEPSAALDVHSAEAYWQAMKEETAGDISIFITHYLSGIAFVNRILVLDHGKLVETGTHSELLERNSLYAELFRTQSERLLGIEHI